MAEWYNTDKLDKYAKDANIAFIVGERRIGKTLHFQKKAFELWDKEKLQTMWLRNKKIELSDPAFANDFLNAPKKFGWCPDTTFSNGEGIFTDKTKAEQIIKFQSISTFSNRRGNMTDKVGMIVFDEFMPEDRKYPKRCHIGLMSLTKTVLSGRTDSKCYCLSNFISAGNPYFVGFQIYPKKELDVTYFPNKGLAIEVCRGYKGAIEDDNPWNRIYRAGQYQNYADEKEDSLFNLIARVPKGSRLNNFFIKIDNVIYGSSYKNGLVYWHIASPNTRYIFTPSLQESSDTVMMIPKFVKQIIKEGSELNILRFQNPNIMYAILSIIYDTV